MRHQGTGDRDRISAKSLPPSSCRSFTTHQHTAIDGRFRDTASSLGHPFDSTSVFSADTEAAEILLSIHHPRPRPQPSTLRYSSSGQQPVERASSRQVKPSSLRALPLKFSSCKPFRRFDRSISFKYCTPSSPISQSTDHRNKKEMQNISRTWRSLNSSPEMISSMCFTPSRYFSFPTTLRIRAQAIYTEAHISSPSSTSMPNKWGKGEGSRKSVRFSSPVTAGMERFEDGGRFEYALLFFTPYMKELRL